MTNISCFSKHNTKLVHVCLIFNTFHILLKKHKNLDFFCWLGLSIHFFEALLTNSCVGLPCKINNNVTLDWQKMIIRRYRKMGFPLKLRINCNIIPKYPFRTCIFWIKSWFYFMHSTRVKGNFYFKVYFYFFITHCLVKWMSFFHTYFNMSYQQVYFIITMLWII
jgi:hypothetical protein